MSNWSWCYTCEVLVDNEDLIPVYETMDPGVPGSQMCVAVNCPTCGSDDITPDVYECEECEEFVPELEDGDDHCPRCHKNWEGDDVD